MRIEESETKEAEFRRLGWARGPGPPQLRASRLRHVSPSGPHRAVVPQPASPAGWIRAEPIPSHWPRRNRGGGKGSERTRRQRERAAELAQLGGEASQCELRAGGPGRACVRALCLGRRSQTGSLLRHRKPECAAMDRPLLGLGHAGPQFLPHAFLAPDFHLQNKIRPRTDLSPRCLAPCSYRPSLPSSPGPIWTLSAQPHPHPGPVLQGAHLRQG